MIVRLPLTQMDRPEVWAVRIDRKDLGHFGHPTSECGATTIIGVVGPVERSENSIEFDTSDARLLNLGDGENVYIIEIKPPLTETTREQHLASRTSRGQQTVHSEILAEQKRQRFGDPAFLRACEEEGLPDSVISLADELLRYVRTFSTDALIEGKSRKWYTKPKNFLAITIQNTKKRLCVQVKDTQVLDTLSVAEIHRDKRYVRLFLKTSAELPDIKKAVLASFHV